MCGYLLLKFRENDKKLEKTYKIFEISINTIVEIDGIVIQI